MWEPVRGIRWITRVLCAVSSRGEKSNRRVSHAPIKRWWDYWWETDLCLREKEILNKKRERKAFCPTAISWFPPGCLLQSALQMMPGTFTVAFPPADMETQRDSAISPVVSSISSFTLSFTHHFTFIHVRMAGKEKSGQAGEKLVHETD